MSLTFTVPITISRATAVLFPGMQLASQQEGITTEPDPTLSSMSNPKARKGRISRSVSRSPLASPGDERGDPIARTQSPASNAFVSFQAGSQSGIDKDARRAIRSQAAKASADARKRTIANKLAAKKSMNSEAAGTTSAAASDSASSPSSASASTSAPDSASLTSAVPSRHASGSSSVRSSQMDLSRSYPTTRWHPQMPDLVEYFLTYFVPDATMAAGSDRERIRSQLWPDAMRDTALFHAILLVAASHATVSGAMIISASFLAQLKHTTLESINSAIEWAGEEGRVRDSVIAAIALLGQWELEYGEATTYDTHMTGLVGIVNNLRGGLSGARSPGSKVLPPVVVNLILGAAHDSALYANKRPSFDKPGGIPPRLTPTLPSTLPPGLKDIETKHLILPSLVHLLGRLSSSGSPNPAFRIRISDTRQALSQWDLFQSTAGSFSIFQTMLEDHMKWQAHAHLRLAGLTLSSLLLNDEDYLQSLYFEAQQLQPEVLVGTVYEEVGFWALFSICAASGQCDPRHMQILRRLQLDLGLEGWETAREALSKYGFPGTLNDGAYALWAAVSSSSTVMDPIMGVREPTRYAKSARHPMTYVGASCMNDER